MLPKHRPINCPKSDVVATVVAKTGIATTIVAVVVAKADVVAMVVKKTDIATKIVAMVVAKADVVTTIFVPLMIDCASQSVYV